MSKATVTFYECHQDFQEYGSDDECMVSRIFFNFDINGQHLPNLHVNLKQTVGSKFEDSPLEIGAPVGYKGPFNHDAFKQAAEKYYRELIGQKGRGIKTGKGSNIRMGNNLLQYIKTVSFEVSDDRSGTW